MMKKHTNMIKAFIITGLIITEVFVWTNSGIPMERNIFAAETPADVQAGAESPAEETLGSGLTEEDWEYLILVNKEHPVDENYKPDDLADIKYFAADRDAAGRFLRTKAADAFHMLVEAAAEEGHEIVVTTAYRSYGFQSVLYNNYVARDGQEAADTYSAQPGRSEHQTGLAADVSSPSVRYALVQEYGETEEGIWLEENAWKYGFIIRYPQGKEQFTGYMYEPWHIRYVGLTAAEEITVNALTLEEYQNEVVK